MSQYESDSDPSAAKRGNSSVQNVSNSPQLTSTLPALISRPKEDKVGSTHMYDVDPKIWGRHFWSVFHLLAYAYPENPAAEVQQAIYQVFDAMRVVLPCSDCREGFGERWQEFDIRDYLDSRESLITWIVQVHDSVNEKLGMPELDYADYMEKLTGEQVVQADSSLSEQPETASNASSSRNSSPSTPIVSETRKRAKSLDASAQRRSPNPLAFSAAINNGESLKGMDPKRLRGLQSSAFAQARRFRDASSSSRSRHQPRLTHTASAETAVGATKLWQKSVSTELAQDYFSDIFQARGGRGNGASRSSLTRSAGSRARQKGIGQRVKPPRECENCNRKVLAPSVFA